MKPRMGPQLFCDAVWHTWYDRGLPSDILCCHNKDAFSHSITSITTNSVKSVMYGRVSKSRSTCWPPDSLQKRIEHQPAASPAAARSTPPCLVPKMRILFGRACLQATKHATLTGDEALGLQITEFSEAWKSLHAGWVPSYHLCVGASWASLASDRSSDLVPIAARSIHTHFSCSSLHPVYNPRSARLFCPTVQNSGKISIMHLSSFIFHPMRDSAPWFVYKALLFLWRQITMCQ